METKNITSLKSFLVIWSGQAVSLLGSQLVQFALIWWLTETTDSATVLSMAALVGLIPQIVLGPFVGVLIDRWSRRYTMLTADTLAALMTLGLFFLFWLGYAQVWHVFIILFIRALATAFHMPAMSASTVLMVPEKHLTRVQGMNQILQGCLNVGAAPFGALLLEVLSIQGILVIDVVTALFAIVPLLLIYMPQPPRAPQDAEQTFSYWSDLRAGFRYVSSWPGLMLLIFITTIANLLLAPAFALLPLLVTNQYHGDAWHLGLLNGIFGVGLILGGLLLSTWGGFKRRMMTAMIGVIGLGIGTIVLGVVPVSLFWLAMIAAITNGITASLANGPLEAIYQAVVDPEMQGRVFALADSLGYAATPIGFAMVGPVVDLMGVSIWYIIGGMVAITMGIIGLLIPAVYYIENGRNYQTT